MLKYFTFFICLAVSVESFAQITWQKKSGPYGGSIQEIVVHSVNGTVYALAGNNNGTIFRSTDNGVSWTTHAPAIMGNERVEDLYRLPNNSILALTREDLFQTVDDGANWTKVNSGSGTDAGGFDNGHSVGVNPVSGTWYVMGYHYGDFVETLFRSLNGGSTWISGHQGFDIYQLSQIVTTSTGAVYGVDYGGEMFVSLDDGASFNSVGGDLANTASLISKSDGSQLLAMTNSSTLWSLTPPGGWVNTYPETGIVNFTNYASNSHLVISPDNGTYFLFDNVNNRVYSKSGVAVVWSPQSSTFVNTAGDNATCGAAKDGTVLYAGTQDLGVFKSINTGLGWAEVNNGIESANMKNLVVADDNSIITGGQRAYRSTNGGNSFTRIAAPTGYYTALKATTGSPKPIFLLEQNGTVSYKSTDNGVNWAALTTPNNAYDYVSPDGTKILGFSNNQLYYTSNAGVGWSAALTVSGLPATFSIQRIAMDQNAVIYTYLYDNTAGAYKFFKIVPNNMVNPTTATATQIALSTIGTTNYIDGIKFLNNKIYVLGENNTDYILSVTSNAGANWTQTTLQNGGFNLEVDPINNYLFIIKSNGGSYTIYLSRDDGTTWVPSTVPLASFKANPYGLALDANGVAYLGFNSSSVHKTLGTIVTPLAPVNLLHVGRGKEGLTLRFDDAATNEEGFTIEREINGVFTEIESGSSGSEFMTGRRLYVRDRDLTPATTYNYRVSAYNDGGSSAFEPISVLTLAASTPNIPDNHSWTGETANADGLGAPATNTEIGIKHLGNGRYSITDVTAGILTAITGDAILPAFFYEASGGTYFEPSQVSNTNLLEHQNGTWNGTNQIILFWRLDKDGSGGPYPDKFEQITLTRNISDPAPGPPTDVYGYVYSSTSIEVTWKGAFYEDQFIIERGTSSGGPFTPAGTVSYPATRFVDDGSVLPLTLTSTYFYRVKGSNSTGTSAPSVVSPGVTFTIPNFVLTDSEVSNNSSGAGTGFIWRDFDNDGDEDLILTHLHFFFGPPRTPDAFRNDGGGIFTKVDAGLEASKYVTGTAADYDNDGNMDIFLLTTVGENLLYKGNGNFTFTKVDPNPVGEGSSDLEGASLSSGWIDFDKNGKLDLFVANSGVPNVLFSQSAAGTFTKVANGEELVTYIGSASCHSWADYDNDGDADVFVMDNSSSTSPNRLYRNNGDGTFTRVTGLEFDTDLEYNGFGTSWGDYDNDGDLDLFMGIQQTDGTTLGENVVYRNNGAGGSYTFTKVANAISTAEVPPNPLETFGSAWGDIDNDGNLDLLTAKIGGNIIYKGNGAGVFTRIKNEKFNDVSLANFGVSLADYDKDGFLDVGAACVNPLLFEEGATEGINSLLFKNNHTASASRNWIQIKLVGTASNKSAIGARVTLTAGGKTQIREVTTTSGFATGGSLIAHFGLGSSTTITTIQVRWPSGFIQTISGQTANVIITITEDNTGPVITNRLPVNGALAASTNTLIGLDLDEASTAVATKKLYVYKTSDLVTPVASFDVTTGNHPNANRFEFTLPQKLEISTNYTITIDAGAFEDVYGNDFLGSTTGWTFTTSAGPQVSVLTPANLATGVAANTTIAIEFDVATTAVAAKNIRLFKPDDVNPIATILTTSGTVSGNKHTYTLATKLERLTSYTVSVDAGAFIDAESNSSGAIAVANWGFTTGTGPIPATLAPTAGATNVAVNTSLGITFDRNITAVAGKKIKVFEGATTTVVLDVDVSLTGTVNAAQYTVAAPAGNWPYEKTLRVVLDAGAFVDVGLTDAAGISGGTWTFGTVEAPDVDAPVFGSISSLPSSVELANLPQGFNLQIDDDKAVTVAKMFHRKISGSGFTEVSGGPSTGITWQFGISAAVFDAIGVQYYFTANDAANNSARSPATGYYQTYVIYPASATTIPGGLIGSGGTKAGWKVIAVPFELSPNNAVSTVLEELTGNSALENKIDYRLLKYSQSPSPTGSWISYADFNSIDRGVGYFINIKDTPPALSVGDNLTAPSNTRDNLFPMSLKAGWNMIGNPYLTPIDWGNVVALNGLSGTGTQLKKYNGTTYINGTTLVAYEGGFVQVGADIVVSIPFQGQTTVGGRQKEIVFRDGDWLVPITLAQGEIVNTFGGVGMYHDAQLSYDDLDDVNGPRFFDFLEMNFEHPEHYARKFARDVVPTQQDYTWDFSVASNVEGMATLNWDNSLFSVHNKELYLYDITLQSPVDMKDANSYTFDPRQSSRFKVYFGDNAREKIKPARVMLGAAYPNPTTGSASIPFSLPENSSKFNVRLEVFDMLGRKVATLAHGEFSTGFYLGEWTAQDNNLVDGVYTYRLLVGGGKNSEVLSGKIMLRK